jgi:cytochrome oxidase Cu insertion factor (SCO1/SenC/PrrC family)
MRIKISYLTIFAAIMVIGLLFYARNTITAPAAPSAVPAIPAAVAAASPTPGKPDWFGIALEDAQTGEMFSMNDFAGKVVLVQTIAEWCTNCAYQENEVRDMTKALGNPDGIVVVSLDVDSNEDKASLKEYADYFDFGSRMAVSPLEVSRALGNLYSAEYLNPPLDPMLIIDRQGAVYGLPYGLKTANQLKNTLAQYLQ